MQFVAGVIGSIAPDSAGEPQLDYFKEQTPGGWCGMHALTNYLRGRNANRDDRRFPVKSIGEDLMASVWQPC